MPAIPTLQSSGGRLESLANKVNGQHSHDDLAEILRNYADLLRATNTVVLRPTEEDLAYLKKVGAVSPSQDLDDLGRLDSLSVDTVFAKLDEKGMVHIARL